MLALRVGVDGEDLLRRHRPDPVLDGPGDAARDVELGGDAGARLADLVGVVAPAVVGDRPRAADHPAERGGELLERGEALGRPHAAPAADDDGGRGERDARLALHPGGDDADGPRRVEGGHERCRPWRWRPPATGVDRVMGDRDRMIGVPAMPASSSSEPPQRSRVTSRRPSTSSTHDGAVGDQRQVEDRRRVGEHLVADVGAGGRPRCRAPACARPRRACGPTPAGRSRRAARGRRRCTTSAPKRAELGGDRGAGARRSPGRAPGRRACGRTSTPRTWPARSRRDRARRAPGSRRSSVQRAPASVPAIERVGARSASGGRRHACAGSTWRGRGTPTAPHSTRARRAGRPRRARRPDRGRGPPWRWPARRACAAAIIASPPSGAAGIDRLDGDLLRGEPALQRRVAGQVDALLDADDGRQREHVALEPAVGGALHARPSPRRPSIPLAPLTIGRPSAVATRTPTWKPPAVGRLVAEQDRGRTGRRAASSSAIAAAIAAAVRCGSQSAGRSARSTARAMPTLAA